MFAFIADGFAPTTSVWLTEGRDLVRAKPDLVSPSTQPDCAELVAVMDLLGLDIVPDHDVWLGEINGLEVARVGHIDGACAMEIGVGAHDQIASAALDADRDPAAALRRVVDLVRPFRTAGAAPHAIGRMVRSRWLRSQAWRNPSLIGVQNLQPVPLLEPRPGLNEIQPAAALADDGQTLCVFVAGIDVGVAETVAALSQLHEVDNAVVVHPRQDAHPRVSTALERLRIPIEERVLEGEWA